MTYRQSDWRPLGASLGKTTEVKIEADGTSVIKTTSDEVPTLANNHALRELSASDGGFVPGTDKGMKRVASIPAALIAKWRYEEGIDVFNPEHAERVMRKLNDPDYAYLRTAPGRLALTSDGESFR